MSDIKPKLILRPGVNISEKSPSPSTKLMLNHGKPNFTINRSKSKVESQQTPPTPTTPEASQIVLKSTTFNGFVKPSNLNLSTENEVNKVVLRRTRLPEASDKPVQDDEPEFIKAQRKIAERLAKETNLDFETRKSGYFTHVIVSPTTPKTMELPVIEGGKIQKATVLNATVETEVVEPESKPFVEESQPSVPEPTQNGHENVEVPQTNGTAENVKEPEVIQVAKALVEEVVQNVPEDIPAAVEPEPVQNGLQNGDSHPQENGHAITPPVADVNFEPKTVVSFSKELSNEPNHYPDTVKVTKEVEPTSKDTELLQEMSKLKFDITADSADVKVTPVLRDAE